MNMKAYQIHQGGALSVLRAMESDSIDCCITSPPYWGLRDYGHVEQIGLETTPEEFTARLVEVFREVRRVLKPDGTCWVNLGDSYAAQGGGKQAGLYEDKRSDGATWQSQRKPTPGLKPKDLVGIPWRVAFAFQADGWWLRQDIIWAKPNPMPESVTDRCTKAHEYIFLLTKSAKYFYNSDAVKESHVRLWDPKTNTSKAYKTPGLLESKTGLSRGGSGQSGFKNSSPNQLGRNKRSVWTLATMATPEAHFATFPLELPETCLLAGSRPGGLILDPFNGAGTTGLAALKNGRRYVGIELNPAYIAITHQRFQKYMPLLAVSV